MDRDLENNKKSDGGEHFVCPVICPDSDSVSLKCDGQTHSES